MTVGLSINLKVFSPKLRLGNIRDQLLDTMRFAYVCCFCGFIRSPPDEYNVFLSCVCLSLSLSLSSSVFIYDASMYLHLVANKLRRMYRFCPSLLRMCNSYDAGWQ